MLDITHCVTADCPFRDTCDRAREAQGIASYADFGGDCERYKEWKEEADDFDRAEKALEIILRYGGIDGEHHKTWVIDQIARILTGDHYEEWVREACDGEDGPDTYGWDVGIAP